MSTSPGSAKQLANSDGGTAGVSEIPAIAPLDISRVAPARRSRMIANLDRSKPGERGKLLEELKTVLAAYLDSKLAASPA